jgi:hypothetical protein
LQALATSVHRNGSGSASGISVVDVAGERRWNCDAPREVATLLDHSRWKSRQAGKESKGYWRSWLQPQVSKMRRELEVALIYPDAVFFPRDSERAMGYGLHDQFVSSGAVEIPDLDGFEGAARTLSQLIGEHGFRISWTGVG